MDPDERAASIASLALCLLVGGLCICLLELFDTMTCIVSLCFVIIGLRVVCVSTLFCYVTSLYLLS